MRRTISEIYKEYKIFPNLQLHMLRVAAVASVICDSNQEEINKENIVTACLLHDMGNIVKTRFDIMLEFFEPEGVEYWKTVKEDFAKKYSSDDAVMTLLIAKEIGVSSEVLSLIESIGFAKCVKNEQQAFDNKIANYSDLRAGPYGVVSMKDRIAEAHKRYLGTNFDIGSVQDFELLSRSAQNIEQQIFEKSSIKPEDITEEKIKSVMMKLKDFVIN